jgi:hypothetical protein
MAWRPKIPNIPIGRVVTLTDVEVAIVRGIAKKRYNACRAKGIKNSKVGEQSNEQTDAEGFGAELAFCKLHNIYPDLEIKPRVTEDDDGDARLPIEGGLVDVKSTTYTTGRLITAHWKKPDTVDLYALMVGTLPTYTFKGFIRARDLLIPEKLGSLTGGKATAYIAEQGELSDLKGILA